MRIIYAPRRHGKTTALLNEFMREGLHRPNDPRFPQHETPHKIIVVHHGDEIGRIRTALWDRIPRGWDQREWGEYLSQAIRTVADTTYYFSAVSDAPMLVDDVDRLGQTYWDALTRHRTVVLATWATEAFGGWAEVDYGNHYPQAVGDIREDLNKRGRRIPLMWTDG